MRRRVSLAELLGLVALCALGLGALRSASHEWMGGVTLLMLLALFTATLGALVRTRPPGAWIGFALFGWGAYLLTSVGALDRALAGDLHLSGLFSGLGNRWHAPPQPPKVLRTPPNPFGVYSPTDVARQLQMQSQNPGGPPLDPAVPAYLDAQTDYHARIYNTARIARSLLSLAIGYLGSLLGRVLAARCEPPAPSGSGSPLRGRAPGPDNGL